MNNDGPRPPRLGMDSHVSLDQAPAVSYYGYSAATDTPTEPSYYMRVLYRRRWTVVTAFIVVLIGTILYSFTSVPMYEARVRVLTDSDQLNLVNVPDVVQHSANDTQEAILRSRWLARRTLQSLHLLGAAAPVQVSPDARSRGMFSMVAMIVRSTVSIATAPYHWLLDPPLVAVQNVEPGETAAEAQQIDSFLGGLVLPAPQAGIMDIAYRSIDPVLAARYANAITQAYVDQSLERRSNATKDVTDWLAARLNEQRQVVQTSEQALQRYREQNGLLGADYGSASTPADAKLTDLNTALMTAKTATIEKESLYQQARGMQNDPAALEMLPVMLQNPVLQQLRTELTNLQRERAQASEKYLDQHPVMIKLAASIDATQSRLRAEIGRAVAALGTEAAAARETEKRLQGSIEGEKQGAMALNRKSVELGILQRDVEGSRQIYQMLEQRSRETNIAEKLEPRTIRVLDPARVPLTPVSPNKARQLEMGVLGGLVLGVALAFGFELLDNRIKTPEQIETLLKLPFLGLVPQVQLAPGTPSPLVTQGTPAQFSEAIRSVRTNVLFSFASTESKTLVITSATMGEGKTAISTNLAVAMAQTGQRVLLVDADMRRPRVHRVFGTPREPGLSDLLVGTAKFTEVAQRSTASGLWTIPAGHRPPNASELLGSKGFRKFLHAMSEHFDWIIIDSPPVMAVTDAPVVAHAADGVVFVVGAEMTAHQVVRRAVDQCRQANVNVIGAVLNRVQIERHSYYYSPYYSSDYAAYHEPAREDAEAGAVSV